MDMSAGPRKIESISTSSIPLDIALGIGGIPRGRIVEIFGPESSGKTTLAYHILANAQKDGGVAAFIDTEHAMDARYCRSLGVNIDTLVISQPDSAEEALEIVDNLVQSKAVDLIVLDSVAALAPRAELEGQMGDMTVGLLARLMSQACRKLVGAASQTDTTIIFINQIREKIGVSFGSPETQPGGRALKFYSSQRIDIRRIGSEKDGDKVIANKTRVKVVKNKVAPPFAQAEFPIVFGEGIDNPGWMIDACAKDSEHGLNELITQSGAWFSFYDGERRQGKAAARRYLLENPEVLAEIEAKVRAALVPNYDDEDKPDPEEEIEPTDEQLDHELAKAKADADAAEAEAASKVDPAEPKPKTPTPAPVSASDRASENAKTEETEEKSS